MSSVQQLELMMALKLKILILIFACKENEHSYHNTKVLQMGILVPTQLSPVVAPECQRMQCILRMSCEPKRCVVRVDIGSARGGQRIPGISTMRQRICMMSVIQSVLRAIKEVQI